MKFLIIHNQYSRTGGEESVVSLQRQLLERHGHQVVQYTRRHGEVGRLKSFFTAIYNRLAIAQLKRVVAVERPDVAIVHNLFPVISAAIIPMLKDQGIEVLMTLHNYRLVCPNGLFYTHGKVCERCGTSKIGVLNCIKYRCHGTTMGSIAWAARNIWAGHYFEKVDRFMALSEFQRDKIVKYSGLDPQKFEIVPNCIDPLAMPTSNAQRGEFIGIVGRLSAEKGIDLLFETARLLPGTEFRVAGERAENFSTEQIPPNVQLMGLLNRDELADFYSSARAIVLTSSCYEGFPLTVIEAMYYRSTVIVPAWAALLEIVDGGRCGVLYEPGSATDLVAKITDNRNTADAGHERVFEKYNAEKYYQNIMHCIAAL